MALKIKYQMVCDGVTKPQLLDKGEWIDLRVSENVHLSQGEFAMLPLGIRMKIPEGFEAHIAPRSSTYKNFRILQVNSPGVVDSSYCGKDDMWRMPVLAMEAVGITKDTRICQFRIVLSQKATIQQKRAWLLADGVELVEEEWLTGSEDSRGGFGSTGMK